MNQFGFPSIVGMIIVFVLQLDWLTTICCGQLSRDEMRSALETFRHNHDVPAIFAAIAFDEREPLIASNGIRRIGDDSAVTDDDLVHIGSCTKAMTAVLVARLVESGQLSWNETLGERLPELCDQIDAGWHSVTLTQLLSHQSGMPANARNWWLRRGESMNEIRDQILIENLKEPPSNSNDASFLYSNLGYMAAGQMAARANGTTWEEAIRQHVFEPLGITTAGFGPPGTIGQVDQPWGHLRGQDGKWYSRQFDNAPALGPAGVVHLGLRDWCRFVTVFCGACPPGFLTDDSLRRLTTPLVNHYALGWGVAERKWAQGTTFSHSGSNTMWDCVVWVAPNTRRAYMVAANCHDENTRQWLDQLVGELIRMERSARQ